MPSDLISALDDALAAPNVGSDITLRRIIGQGANTTNVDVGCRAVVREITDQEIVAGVNQSRIKVIMSPTPIINAQWPGGQIPYRGPNPNAQWLPVPNDKIIRSSTGRAYNIVAPVQAFDVNGEIVRIELMAVG